MPEVSAKRFAAYTGIAFAAGAGVLALVFALGQAPAGASGDDDQPPIIVRDGSIIFDGGDSKNPNKGQDTWKDVDAAHPKQHWMALKTPGNGHHVRSFTAYIEGVVDQGCPQTTIVGDSIDIDYTEAGTTALFHLHHVDDGTKNGDKTAHHSPQVDSDELPMRTGPKGSTIAQQVLAGTDGQGWISRVAGKDSSSGAPVECKISAASPLVRVSIVPERYK